MKKERGALTNFDGAHAGEKTNYRTASTFFCKPEGREECHKSVEPGGREGT